MGTQLFREAFSMSQSRLFIHRVFIRFSVGAEVCRELCTQLLRRAAAFYHLDFYSAEQQKPCTSTQGLDVHAALCVPCDSPLPFFFAGRRCTVAARRGMRREHGSISK